MASGLYQDHMNVERFLASVSASNLPQVYVAPCDLDVLGLLAVVGTAPGVNDGVTVNVNNFPTSQQGGALSSVGAYNLWTAANVPTILGSSKNSFTTSNAATVIRNLPYALNYPLPGPSGQSGYVTAQSTAQSTQTPLTAPPVLYEFGLGALVQPDNTYTDYNGIVRSAALVSAGDVLTFTVGAAGSGASVGAAANLEILLYTQKR